MSTIGKLSVFLLILALLSTCKKDGPIPQQENTGTSPKTIAIDAVAKNLKLPWGLVYLPGGDLLFTEREGNINLLKAGESTYKTILKRQVNSMSEGGLLSITIDPMFSTNRFVYIYETLGNSHNRVFKLLLENDALSEVKIIVDNIPYGVNHDGGALKFGPDGYLYVGTGDVTQYSLAQDKNSLAGKILRVDRDGNPAPGNPFNSLIWTYGHRNVQGFTWTTNGQMLATEHGPSGEFGWCCHDEINLIQPGKNYGWPLAYGGMEKDSLTPSLINSGDDTWAPSGCTWLGPQSVWPNTLVVASLRGERLLRFQLNGAGTAIVSGIDTLKEQFNRLRNIVEAPDGSLVFCSSNIGTIKPALAEDDKVYRLYKH